MAAIAHDFQKPSEKGASRLVAELEDSWRCLAAVSHSLSKNLRTALWSDDSACTLAQLHQRYDETRHCLLSEPTNELVRAQPIRRTLESLQEFDRSATRAAVRSRFSMDRRFQRLLDAAALEICEPWRIKRSGGAEEEWFSWEKRAAKRDGQAREQIAAYRKWAAKSEDAGGIDNAPVQSDRQDVIQNWWKNEAAVSAMQEMELAFCELALMWLNAIEALVATLRSERDEIIRLTQEMVEWVTAGANEGTVAPVESMMLGSCDEYLRSLSTLMEEEAAKRLPLTAAVPLPRMPSRSRTTRPREAFLSNYKTFCEPSAARSVREYWERTARIVREAGRSKEIIDYWRKSPERQQVRGEALYADARNNAAGVLTELLRSPASDDSLEASLVQVFQSWLREGFTVLEGAQIGWVELLRLPRGRRLSKAVTREGRRQLRSSVHRAGRWGSDQWQHGLELLAGKLPERPTTAPVIRRCTLRDTLSLPASKNELPAIYASLFRLVPIEDRRFLVGRDRELAGLEQALADWESGRFAACIFVGARGSGKTSLLNCAGAGAFLGRTIIRAQFSDRAVTADDIDNFLIETLLPGPGEDLASCFSKQRRILMIEEGERIYLRKAGGFHGAIRLMHWIQKTSSTTLWVLAMNDRAFRVLRAGAHFSRIFSHRINAMSVSRELLENAIMERHRLSGLRLEFSPPPPSDPRVSRLKNFLGLRDSPQKLYFDSLYQQSGGVFRAAFELWLSSIERVEGNTLKIRQPLEPAFGNLRAELSQEDLFTILIIQEHGSLEYEEAAEVLLEEVETVRARIDRLLALGLVDRDPDHRGFRIRPEAHRFTSDVLRRVNLVQNVE